MGILSKGIKLSYKTSGSQAYTALTNLQSIPDLGGIAESIEITTLDDAAHTYMNGILSYGDELAFTFLYEPTQFSTLQTMSGANAAAVDWKVELPDGTAGALDTACTFSGTCTCALAGVGVNEALTYTLSIKPNSAMVWA